MKKAIVMLALFPFLHATSYEVKYVSCKANEMVVSYHDEHMNISFFNTRITKQKGWEHACSLMKDAKQLHIEIDPSSSTSEQRLPVYVFADGRLVQEELIADSEAYPMIHNPEYTYEKRLEDAMNTTSVMAKTQPKEKKESHAFVAPIYLCISFLLWSIMLFYAWWKHRKKQHIKIK